MSQEVLYPPGLRHAHQHNPDGGDPLEDPFTVEQLDPKKLLVTAVQSDGTLLNVTVNGFIPPDVQHNVPYFAELPHDTLTTVWTPASGNCPHLRSFIVSTEAAGVCYLYKNDEEFTRLEFNEKKSQPFDAGTDVCFDPDTVLKAKFVGDAATPSAYITMVGHEHTPS